VDEVINFMFIVDFDYTLYKTDLFERDMKNVLCSFGVSAEIYKDSYKQALKWEGDGYGFDYTFPKHIKILQEKGFEIDLDKTVAELDDCIKKEYLFDDAIIFLKFLKDLGDRVVILTAGNPDFQKNKLSKVGVVDLVDECVYLYGNKQDFVEEILSKERKVVFINDNSKENTIIKKQFPNLEIIGIVNSYKYDEAAVKASGVPYFKTLSEIKKYIARP
jgi:phosphoserine phosphatase